MIKAVSLDFGGTLASGGLEWEPYHEAIRSHLGSYGYIVSMGDLKKALRNTLEELEKYRAKGLDKTFEDVYADFLHRLRIQYDKDLLTDLHINFKKYYKSDFYSCIKTLIPELADRYKLALLSNTMSDQPRELLIEAGLDRYFKLLICSRDLGMRKPNPKIFRYIAENLGVEPREVVHVGDNVEADMYGARDVGMTGVWIKSPNQLPWNGYAIKSICELSGILNEIDV